MTTLDRYVLIERSLQSSVLISIFYMRQVLEIGKFQPSVACKSITYKIERVISSIHLFLTNIVKFTLFQYYPFGWVPIYLFVHTTSGQYHHHFLFHLIFVQKFDFSPIFVKKLSDFSKISITFPQNDQNSYREITLNTKIFIFGEKQTMGTSFFPNFGVVPYTFYDNKVKGVVRLLGGLAMVALASRVYNNMKQ